VPLDSSLIAAAHNTVWRDTDHCPCEINCIRGGGLCAQDHFSARLHVVFDTEPCPMCLSAIHWAKIERVIYGATIADAAAAGFAELHVGARELAELGKSPVRVEHDCCRKNVPIFCSVETQVECAGVLAAELLHLPQRGGRAGLSFPLSMLAAELLHLPHKAAGVGLSVQLSMLAAELPSSAAQGGRARSPCLRAS